MECAVFDTEALLAYYLGEAGGDVVMRLLESVSGRKVKGCINVVHLAELYCVLHRKSQHRCVSEYFIISAVESMPTQKWIHEDDDFPPIRNKQ